jgi:hypothetical protein
MTNAIGMTNNEHKVNETDDNEVDDVDAAEKEDVDAVTIDDASNEAEEICPGKTEAPEIDDVSTRKTDNERSSYGVNRIDDDKEGCS